ncbi:MAG TPA: DoxX family protein [Thermoanaerobaculia bacterium]|nr:DoxX family protein [Thermoanaerobaculia bacterium]
MGFLGRFTEPIYALLRIVSGFLFACHGVQKMFGALGGQKVPPSAGLPFVAGVLELVLGVLILIGLFTSLAAFLASGEMAVAYFMVHQPNGGLPIQNQGELAALYCFVFLYIAARGAGIWSLDGLMRRRR